MTTTIPLTARDPRPFTPPSLAADWETAVEKAEKAGDKKPKKPVFQIAVPTLSERETIGSIMFELGVMRVTRDTVRNATLESVIDNEGEDEALWLEGFWGQTTLYEEMIENWQQQVHQHALDMMANPKLTADPPEKPPHLTSLKDRIKAKNLVDKVVKRDQHVRSLFADQTKFQRLNDIMMMRLHLRGWDGLETQREAEAGAGFDLVTEECIDQLRLEIGMNAWQEIHVRIDEQYSLGAEEVGNSDSPAENTTTKPGSKPSPEEASGGSNGTRTAKKSSSKRTRKAG